MRFLLSYATIACLLCNIAYLPAADPPIPPTRYAAPAQVAWSPSGQHLAISDSGLGLVLLVRATDGAVVSRVPVGQAPHGVAWSADGQLVWIGDSDGQTLSAIQASTGTIVQQVSLSRYLRDVVALPGNRVAVCAAGMDRVIVLDASLTVTSAPTIGYQPEALAVTPDGTRLLAVPLLPQGAATDPTSAVSVRILAADTGAVQATILLPPGSTNARSAAITPDGRWGLVTHILGKADMPNTHVDQGWVSTNALSIIDLQTARIRTTLLLDQPHAGSADPWGVTVTPDGTTCWVTCAGIDAIARLDLGQLLGRITGVDRSPPPADWPAIWGRIAREPAACRDLAWDLGALPLARLLHIIPINGHGPRAIAISPDGRTMAVAVHFDGSVRLCNAQTGVEQQCIRWSAVTEPDAVQRGATLFHNANNAYQSWISCASCHPGVRADGLNWDLLNDGVGNPKNTRSLLLADRRAPVMSLGVRKDGPTAVGAGFRFIAYHEPSAEQVSDLLAFLRSLQPVPSPHLLPTGDLSDAAIRGQRIFAGKASCIDCHSGTWYSDQQLHDVGTIRNPLDTGRKIVTPMLVELWRTAPYLHDGSAATLLDVLVTRNPTGAHGDAADLNATERADLIAYLLSL
jgi:DNA-binding beta-propeller fold protein YncE